MMTSKTYTTDRLSTISGVSLRQLQWWDERGVIRAARDRRGCRIYTAGQALAVTIISDMKQRGFSLPQVRKLQREIVRACDLQIMAILEGRQPDRYLFVGRRNLERLLSQNAVVTKCSRETPPFIVINLDEKIVSLAMA